MQSLMSDSIYEICSINNLIFQNSQATYNRLLINNFIYIDIEYIVYLCETLIRQIFCMFGDFLLSIKMEQRCSIC